MRQVFAQFAMRLWQLVERNRRIEMVLGVKRHVPHQQPDHGIRQRCPSIGQAVLIGRAAGVLGNQDRPQDWLSQNRREEEVEPGERVPQGDRNDAGRLNRRLDSRLNRHHRPT